MDVDIPGNGTWNERYNGRAGQSQASNVQELQHDPLGILRPSSKLHHQLPLASAYAAMAGCRDGGAAVQRQQRRMDTKTREPKVITL